METKYIIEILERMEKNQQDFYERIEAILISQTMINEQWIDTVEAEKLLGVSTKTIYRFNKNGTLVSRRIGRRNYFSRSAIFNLRDRFLK